MTECVVCKDYEVDSSIIVERAFIEGFLLGWHVVNKGALASIKVCARHRRQIDEGIEKYNKNI